MTYFSSFVYICLFYQSERMMPSVIDELVDILPSLYPSHLLTITHALQTHRDILRYFILNVNAPVGVGPLLFNVKVSIYGSG